MKLFRPSLIRAILLAGALLLVFCGTALAAESGKCGTTLDWTLDDDGVLTISGSGEMTSHPWTASAVHRVEIGEGVTSIVNGAFSGCSQLSQVTIPDTISEIGREAFNSCTSLVSIDLPAGLGIIRDGTFSNCSILYFIYIPRSVYSIGPNAFSGCPELTFVTYRGTSGQWADIYIDDGNNALKNAERHYNNGTAGSLNWKLDDDGTLILYGSGEMDDYWIWGDVPSDLPPPPWTFFTDRIEKVDIRPGITGIGQHAFNYSPSLRSVTVPSTVVSIGQDAFSNCDSLGWVYYRGTEAQWHSISIAGGNSALVNADRYYITSKCGPDLTWDLDENGLLTITGTGSMYDFNIWEGAPSSNPVPPWSYFTDRIRNVVVGYGATCIGEQAFNLCPYIVSVTLPVTVTSVRSDAFNACASLSDVYFNGTPDRWNSISVIPVNEPLTGAALHCYTNVLTLPESLTAIPDEAFANVKNVAFVVPASVQTISATAFDPSALIICPAESYAETRALELGLALQTE